MIGVAENVKNIILNYNFTLKFFQLICFFIFKYILIVIIVGNRFKELNLFHCLYY